MKSESAFGLPGLNCGLCGYRKCEEFAVYLAVHPEEIKRCIHLSTDRHVGKPASAAQCACPSSAVGVCGAVCGAAAGNEQPRLSWVDSLNREVDFYLEHFPEDPGPRETITPHNPMLTRELDIQVGDVLIGRPLGMSCGCPVTHCGIVTSVEKKNGVIVWCVTGPLEPRAKGYKDLGYYVAQAYEGIVRESRKELRIGMRYFFQPRTCMLQWRHSGLINYINHTPGGTQIRIEGLYIG